MNKDDAELELDILFERIWKELVNMPRSQSSLAYEFEKTKKEAKQKLLAWRTESVLKMLPTPVSENNDHFGGTYFENGYNACLYEITNSLKRRDE